MTLMRNKFIKFKLTAIMMTICTVVLLVATSAFLTYELVSSRRTMVQDLSTLAKVIGTNCVVQHSFLTIPERREKRLQHSSPSHILFRQLFIRKPVTSLPTYRADKIQGSLLAREPSADKQFEAKMVRTRQDGYEFHANHLDVFQTIHLDNEMIGSLHLQSDLGRL